MKKAKKQRKKVEDKAVNKVKTIEVILLLALIIILLSVNYPFLDKKVENFLTSGKTSQAHIERVIDGDTIVASSNEHIRLLGINTPERGEFLYEEAKGFLENLVKNKTVILEFTKDKYDKYNRTLAYVFIEGKNVNVEMVGNGFANYYFYSGLDKYSIDLKDAWKSCIEKNKNLCEKSENQCAECVNIDGSSLIVNSCSFSCDISGWQVKGEGREKFIFSKQTIQPGANSRFALDLTNSGGSIFLRDEKGKLVVWKSS
jgi:endonuclease YncB( thermonuclease family)